MASDLDLWIRLFPVALNTNEECRKNFETQVGGWLLISNLVMQSSSCPSQLPVKTYRGISSDQMVLTKDAMAELSTCMSFTKLRFHCNKKNGLTFHVTTAANSSGGAVLRYLSGQTDVQPNSCGSFVRMENDNSTLGRVCEKWGWVNGTSEAGIWGSGFDQDRSGGAVLRYLSGQTDVQPNSRGSFIRMENDTSKLGEACERWGQVNGTREVGKWGAGFDQDRLYNHAAFVAFAYHLALHSINGNRCECDDYRVGVSSDDFWKIYVR